VSFPAYVPAAVQKYISARLYGSDGARGWVNAAKEPGNEWIAEIVAFLQRFERQNELIQEMFRHLDDAMLSEADQHQFMNAAMVSRTDFTKYRDAVKRAAKLNQDIATKAEELAGLLDAIQGRGLSDLPMEFYDVRTLLHETDNRRDLTWWGVNRGNLTGKSAGENALYAWGIAPSLAELLGTVAQAASNYEPRFYGRTGAAIEKRQPNPKTEFIRAFGYMLAEAGIPATPPVMNAMACMTTIAIDDGDTIACYDDVKQALGLKQKPAG
jgi:hypothetical protein